MFFVFLVKKTSGILFCGSSFPKPARKASSGGFRAGLRKLRPQNNIPEVFLRGSATQNRLIFQLCFIIPKIKLYVCRILCENFIQIGQKMKKL